MEEIIKQEISFAQIELYKNYCHISEKPEHDTFPDISKTRIKKYDDGDLFFETEIKPIKEYVMSAAPERLIGYSSDMMLYPKDNRHFFYTKMPIASFINHALPHSPVVHYEPIRLTNVKKSKNYPRTPEYFETTNCKHIIQHYNNPFAEIRIYKIERWIKREDNKITMKLFMNVRTRRLNKIYFTKQTESTTITFNIRTGNFNVITFKKIRKKQLKHFYSNSFTSLKQALGVLYNSQQKTSSLSLLHKEYEKIFNNEEFQWGIKEAFNFDETSEIIDKLDTPSNFMIKWIPKFVELKKIKTPNLCTKLITNFYPTEKYLKKNDRKLIAAILDRFGVKSKITIKMLHEHSELNILTLVKLCYLFGENFSKYIGNIPWEFFLKGKNNNDFDIFAKNTLLNIKYPQFVNVNNTEKENIIKIIIDFHTNYSRFTNPDFSLAVAGSGYDLVETFFDHYRMLEKVKEYYPELRLNARTYDTFHHEHLELSEIEGAIKTAFSIEYVFDDRMIETIEQPISITELNELPIMRFDSPREAREYEKIYANLPVSAIKRVFMPKVLKTSEDYLDEGKYMHHCVGGYIDYENSIIISLRHEKERVTCEFDARTRKCVQMRYFTNQHPPEYYIKPLEMLKQRISHFSGMFRSVDKIKRRLQINGREVKTEEAFIDNNPF